MAETSEFSLTCNQAILLLDCYRGLVQHIHPATFSGDLDKLERLELVHDDSGRPTDKGRVLVRQWLGMWRVESSWKVSFVAERC